MRHPHYDPELWEGVPYHPEGVPNHDGSVEGERRGLAAILSYRTATGTRNKHAQSANFGGRIATILEEKKYYRSPAGRIDGWGRKWLP